MQMLLPYFALLCCALSLSTGSPPSGSRKNNSSNSSCNMLQTRKFRLDHVCISRSRAAQTALHELTASSLEECEQTCCQSVEGPCDLAYWNSLQKCIVMNYYVLSLCPLLSPTDQRTSPDSSILFSVSQRVTPLLKEHLLRKGYRDGVRTRLGCGADEFVCDNWDCISSKHVCDGKAHCSDNSDESTCSKCLGSNSQYVDVGSQYIPFNDGDKCKVCICGNDSQPVYCYSATCYPNLATNCYGPDRDICCQCLSSGDYHEVATEAPDAPFANLSDTQRLIVSCMSVLVVITLLLFLSRNILHRGRRAIYHNHGFLPRGHRPPGGRISHSSAGRYWRDSDSVSFYDPDAPPTRPPFSDLPPSYNQLKPLGYDVTTNSEEALGPPPSYISETESRCSVQPEEPTAARNRETPIAVAIPVVPTDPEVPPEVQQRDSAPISPLSTTSESPLLTNDDVTKP
uniref:Low-density lipoprotein receptor class A domain-containing protein 3 n=1 Tax=Phallusia mammillata TaxID=59560 RepID=A0A6F9DJP1_9ASCI|nr:low-density lipoprotein receptor class A domain-containing protein 3 [Phallusia mammillata]